MHEEPSRCEAYSALKSAASKEKSAGEPSGPMLTRIFAVGLIVAFALIIIGGLVLILS